MSPPVLLPAQQKNKEQGTIPVAISAGANTNRPRPGRSGPR
ncbi:hypothetical protein [Capillibacterium thermochitinicola]|nr:hypothetical protein [Capillibacterium thermochitinicola]